MKTWPTSRKYKFRAEAWVDALSAIAAHLNAEPILYDASIKIFTDPLGAGGVEVVFDSTATLEELIALLNAVTDGHVMAQTVQLKRNYTGDRDYER